MADHKNNENVGARKNSDDRLKVPDFTKSKMVKKQVSILAKLENWQEQSAKTDWVPGEYLES